MKVKRFLFTTVVFALCARVSLANSYDPYYGVITLSRLSGEGQKFYEMTVAADNDEVIKVHPQDKSDEGAQQPGEYEIKDNKSEVKRTKVIDRLLSKLAKEWTEGVIDSEVPVLEKGGVSRALTLQDKLSSRFEETWIQRPYADEHAKKAVKIYFYRGAGGCSAVSFPYLEERARGCVSSCSGSLVSPFHVLTAGHCVIKDSIRYSDFRIVPAMTDVRDPQAMHGYDYFVETGYGVARAQSVYYKGSDSSLESDLALITLDRPIGIATGHFETATSPPNDEEILTQFGYPSTSTCTGKLGDHMWRRTFQSMRVTSTTIAASVDLCGGDSGSPLLNSAGRVIGVLSRGYNDGCGSCGSPNFFRRLYRSDNLNERICAETCSCPHSASATGIPRLCRDPEEKPDVWDAQRVDDSRFPKHVTALDGSDVFPRGERRVRITATFVNTGPVASGVMRFAFYASTSPNIQFNQGTYLGTFELRQPIQSLEARIIEHVITLPAGNGPWYVSTLYTDETEEYVREVALRIAYLGTVTYSTVATSKPNPTPEPTPTIMTPATAVPSESNPEPYAGEEEQISLDSSVRAIHREAPSHVVVRIVAGENRDAVLTIKNRKNRTVARSRRRFRNGFHGILSMPLRYLLTVSEGEDLRCIVRLQSADGDHSSSFSRKVQYINAAEHIDQWVAFGGPRLRQLPNAGSVRIPVKVATLLDMTVVAKILDPRRSMLEVGRGETTAIRGNQKVVVIATYNDEFWTDAGREHVVRLEMYDRTSGARIQRQDVEQRLLVA